MMVEQKIISGYPASYPFSNNGFHDVCFQIQETIKDSSRNTIVKTQRQE